MALYFETMLAIDGFPKSLLQVTWSACAQFVYVLVLPGSTELQVDHAFASAANHMSSHPVMMAVVACRCTLMGMISL